MECEDIVKLAELANLQLSEDEISTYSKQLSSIIAYINKLKQVNTDNVIATTHATQARNVFFEDGAPNVRGLKDLSGLHVQEIDGQWYFVVKQIL